MSGPASRPLRLLLVAPNAANNSLGRAHCLWLLARHLGWQVSVVTVRGEQLWQPLRDDPFAADCVLLAAASAPERQAALTALAGRADVVLAVKPLPSSFGLALPLGRATGRPVMLDVDDPDIEVRTTNLSLRRLVKDRLLTGRHRELLRLREQARTVPVTVSNPILQGWYGGLLVPHVRPAAEAGPQAPGRDIVVRFVGSPRGHKGVGLLREAVAAFAGDGVRLEITSDAPADARPWESWLGQTSLAAGRALVATADVIAVPSVPDGWSRAQLPAKLVDAMVLGRAVVASDMPPLRWALGDTGVLVPPGDVPALTGTLRALRDPDLRRSLGAAAHERADEMFSVESVAPRFGDYVRTVAGGGPRGGPDTGGGRA